MSDTIIDPIEAPTRAGAWFDTTKLLGLTLVGGMILVTLLWIWRMSPEAVAAAGKDVLLVLVGGIVAGVSTVLSYFLRK